MKDNINQILNISKFVLGLLGFGLCIWLVVSDYPESDAKLSEIDTYITGIYVVEEDGESMVPLAMKYVDTTSAKLDIIETLDADHKEIVEDYLVEQLTVEEISKKHKLPVERILLRVAHGVDKVQKEIDNLRNERETSFVKSWKKRKEQKINDLKNVLKDAKSKVEKAKLKDELDNLKAPKILKTGKKLKNGEEHIMADTQTIQKGDEIDVGKSYSFFAINYVIFVIGLALLGVIGFFLYQLVIRPKITALSILGLLISASLFLILYFVGSSETWSELQLKPSKGTPQAISLASAGIYTIGICLFIGVMSIVLGPLMGRYRKY